MRNNKILRRLSCLCLVLLLMLPLLGAAPIDAMGAAEITFGEVMAKVGDEVAVPVTITNNPGIATFRFRVSYDTDDLEFISAQKGAIITGGMDMYMPEVEKQYVTFTWVSFDANVVEDGEIARLNFRIKETARGEYPLTVTYLPEDILNKDSERIPYMVKDGKISTGSTVSGTVTSFGNATEPVTLRLLENGTEIDKITSTDDTYGFNSVSPGTYTIEVSKLNHATRTYEITVERKDITEALKIHLKGDIDGNGRVNTTDVNRAFAHVRKTNFLTGYELACADVVGTDGKVNTTDVNRIFAHVRKTNLLW